MKRFLRKLINSETWGGKHIPLINLVKVLPKHIRGKKITKESLKELVKKEFLLVKKSTGELHLSLNPKKKEEIHLFVSENQDSEGG